MLLPVVFLMIMGWSHRWIFEDAFLNFRVVDQIRAGHGPVFNVGQRTEVSTSTLWLWILVVLRSLLPFVRIENISIVAGLVASGLGLWWAQRGAAAFWSSGSTPSAPLVPFGALVVVALPASWDWATSGLENGLTMAWIGALTLVLARFATDPGPVGPRRGVGVGVGVGVILGLGPLVRPDLAIMSATCLAAVWWTRRPRRADLAYLLGGFVALPLAYQIFRMGYYATLVPNTALAKDAAGTYWHQGWSYLLDLVMPYWLLAPLAGIVVGAVVLARSEPRPPLVAVLALPVAGALHALYVTKSGGDYLHARLLLPSLFALVAPFAAIPWHRRMLAPLVIVGLWAIVATASLRIDVEPGLVPVTERNFADGRRVMLAFVKPGHDPVHATDFQPIDGIVARRLQREGRRALVTESATRSKPLLDATPERTTLISVTSGVSGYLAGPEVIVHEANSLGDPVGSRMPSVRDAAAGHRKRQSWEWMFALTTRPGITGGYDAAEIAAAQHALQCGALADLLDATSKPLGLERFWANLTGSLGRTRLVVPRDPRAAERKFCGVPPR